VSEVTLSALTARVQQLEAERHRLLAAVAMMEEMSATLRFGDIVQAVARRLGEAFGLDRCSVYLSDDAEAARLVASYEDPGVHNLVVDLARYPELQRAFESGETVFIPDAAADPALADVRGTLDARRVRSIVVIPIRWQGRVIGAIFLRTARDQAPFTEEDVRFGHLVAGITATALWNAYRFESLAKTAAPAAAAAPDEEQRLLLAFLQRLLARQAEREAGRADVAPLPASTTDELDRLVDVAVRVLTEDARA
jgi:GAF domain-containing protein